MRASIRTGAFDLYNPDMVDLTGLSTGVKLYAESGATFRVKSRWTFSVTSATSALTGRVWTTPASEYIIDYAAVQFTTNLVGVHNAGPGFSQLSVNLEIQSGAGDSGLLFKSPLTFTGTYNISTSRSLFTSDIDSATDVGTGDGTQAGLVSFNGRLHAYSNAQMSQPVALVFTSNPTNWSLTGTVEVTICGKIVGG